MKKTFCSVLLALLITQFIFSQSAIDFYNNGRQYQQQEDYVAAIECYQEALLINPNYGSVWFALAQCSYEINEYDRTLECLNKAEKFYTDQLSVQRLKGFAYIGLGNLAEAQKIFDTIIQQYPNDVETMFGLAELQLFTGRISAAENYYLEVLARQSENKKALLSLALISFNLGKFEESEAFINQAINYYNENPQVYYYASYLAIQNKNLAKAEKLIKLALFLDEDYDKAYSLLSYVLYKQNKFDKTIEICDKRLSKNRNSADAWYLKGLSLYQQNKINESIKALSNAIKINPQDEIIRAKIEQIITQNLQIEDTKREEFSLYHIQQAKEASEKYNSLSAKYEYLQALKIQPLNIDARLAYSDWLLNEGLPESCLAQLKFIKKQNVTSQVLDDRIEGYESLLTDTLDKEWSIESFYLDKTRTSIGIYYYDNSSTILHADSVKTCSYLLVNSFDSYPYFSVRARDKSIKSYTEAFRDARNNHYDYFAIINFDENERENTIKLTIYSARTGTSLSEFSVYRTGNKKLASAVQKITSTLVSMFPNRGKIIDRRGSTVLIDLGKIDKNAIDDEFAVIQKGSVSVSDTQIGLKYEQDKVLGSVKLVKLGEEISEAEFSQVGFYDRMNVNDEIILMPKQDAQTTENQSATISTPVTQSPELVDLISSIR